jgi:methylmalonyl-CoA mutase
VNDIALNPDGALSAAYQQWKNTVSAELNGVSFEKKLVTRTAEGIALQPLYTRTEAAGLPTIGLLPGRPPYGRGAAAGAGGRRWQMTQEIGARGPAEFNACLRVELAQGQDSVVLRADAAARAGFAADEARLAESALGGGTGEVTLTSLADLAAALAGVDLATTPVHLRAGQDAVPLAAFHLELAHQRQAAWKSLAGSVTADPLGEWAEAGRLSAELDTLYGSLAGWTAWAAEKAPRLRTIGVNAALWGHAGANAVQELAFALAAGVEYVRALGQRGVAVETSGPRVQFRFAIGPQFFMEIAKLRALRLLWSRAVVAFGAPPAVAAGAALHTTTGRWNKTRLDPHVNLLRVTTEALAAVLGGCDALHIAPFDDVTGTTTQFSRRIARNVHTLLAEEFSFAQVADAPGGSWYVEKLTDELARKAWELFQDLEAHGGFAAALRDGYPQQLVAKVTTERTEALATRRVALIGTNLFPNLKEPPPPPPPVARPAPVARTTVELPVPAEDATWAERFDVARAAAAQGATIAQLARLTRPLASSEWVVVPVAPWRGGTPFEALRQEAEAYTARHKGRPRVFLAKLGPLAQHKARADFAAGYFAVGGFDVLGREKFDMPEKAAQAAAAVGAPVVVLCSTDETYPALVPAFTAALKAAAPKALIVLAGLPADPAVVTAYQAAGVNEFIHVRSRVPDVLTKIFRAMEALT